MKLRFGVLRVWASRLALLLVGFSCVPLWASPVELPSGPFCGSCVLTNITFVDQESYDQYRSNSISRVDVALSRCDSMSSALSSARGNVTSSILYQSLAKRNALDASALCDEPSESDIQQEINYSIAQLTISMDYADQALDSISAAQDTNALVRAELQNVRSALDSGATEYNGMFATSCESSGGGCTCPDYTPFLESIDDYLSSLVTYVSTINDWLDENGNWLVDMVWNFFSEADMAVGFQPDERYEGQYIGRFFGKSVSNFWYAVEALDYNAMYRPWTSDLPAFRGSQFVRDMWDMILRPYAQIMLPSSGFHSDNDMVNAFREFYLHPRTNDVVVNSTVSITNTVSNPLWVTFTNTVKVSVDWDELIDEIHKLPENVWIVSITNVDEFVKVLLEEQKKQIDESVEDMELDEPTEETTTMHEQSLSSLQTLGNQFSTVTTAYRNMFDSIPNSCPTDITLWQGTNLGGVEVKSVHWKPQSSSFQAIRSLFSFFWHLIYVAVIWVTVAIDLCVGGIMLYMVYGLLLGKSEVAYKGTLWCINMLASFLGYKPPFNS